MDFECFGLAVLKIVNGFETSMGLGSIIFFVIDPLHVVLIFRHVGATCSAIT